MKKLLLLLLVNLFLIGQTFAQKATDQELQHLMSVVSTLRQSDEDSWNKALASFKNDPQLTIMDEAVRHDNECWLVGKRQFKLNAILTQCDNYDKKRVSGDFLNGNDPNFNYSLTERGIKKNSTVSYELSYREGRQTFVVMPFEKNAKIKVETSLNGKAVGESTTDDDGNIILSIDAKVNKSDKLILKITNSGTNDMPVVIINHNTRKN
ncbi:MAG: hypothetical protein IKX35_07185 [Bacteroidales bacterium]|nr:hypothetical protein [Bacteroidales bacterium]